MRTAIIGAGNMGGSIARGLAKGSIIPASDIIDSNPSHPRQSGSQHRCRFHHTRWETVAYQRCAARTETEE